MEQVKTSVSSGGEANQEEVKKRARELLESFLTKGEQEVFGPLFGLEGDEVSLVTKEEAEDLRLFAEYALEHLVAFSTPKHFQEEARENISISENSVTHDLLHALAAYVFSGESLRPAYTKVETELEQNAGLDQTKEEMLVTLWDSKFNGNFLKRILRGEDVLHVVTEAVEKGVANIPQDQLEISASAFLDKERALRFLKKENELEYFLRLLSEEYLFLASLFVNPAHREAVKESVGRLQEDRDPRYVEIVQRMYDDSRKETPDPKILLHEFQRVLGPLLVRLKSQKSEPHESPKS